LWNVGKGAVPSLLRRAAGQDRGWPPQDQASDKHSLAMAALEVVPRPHALAILSLSGPSNNIAEHLGRTKMKKLALVMVVVLAGVLAASAQSHKKIGMKRAQTIAASHARGLRLKAKELEHENGAWIYSFEFKNKDGSIREVNVNAYTGKIVGIEHETKKSEADEEKGEMKRKH
jgi:uncharacterized membrane protein YkoI